MIYIGVDPGLKGGIGALNEDGQIVYSTPMPLAGKEISPHEIAKVLREILWKELGKICIEHSQAIHKCSAGSTFAFGMGFGILQGVCAALACPYVLVKPKAWQKVMHVGADPAADPKDRSLQAVYRLFPNATFKASERCKKDHDGVVDALLLAEYCRRLSVGIK